ncbi:hypothetical protein J2Z47_001436 [Cohnella thailandensis]|nr:DUF4185 domain-containing protein [Cohnella thailandensis]MBP1973217.1 hypothetical protein [Cohnella thailandensis]
MKGKIAGLTAAFVLLLSGCYGGGGDEPMLTSKGKDFVLKGVSGLERVSQLTGAESPNKTDRYAVYGTDLGSMINDGDKTYFVFGDTFGERSAGQVGGGGSFWRSNAIGYTTDVNPADGIALDGMITDDVGFPKSCCLRRSWTTTR